MKVGKQAKDLSAKVGSKIGNITNAESALKKLKKERKDTILGYAKQYIDKINENQYVKAKLDVHEQDYTRMYIDIDNSGYGGAIIMNHGYSSIDMGDVFRTVVNVSLSGYSKEVIDPIIEYPIYGEKKVSNEKMGATLEKVSIIAKELSQLYWIMNGFILYKEVEKEVKQLDKEIENIESLATSNPYVEQYGLAEVVANEAIAHAFKQKNFKFQPKKFSDLVKDIKKNKGFYFTQGGNGSGDMFGLSWRYNSMGDNQSAWEQMVMDIVNVDTRLSEGDVILPVFVEKGGLYSDMMSEFKIESKGKNFKGVAKSASSDEVKLSKKLLSAKPRKEVYLSSTKNDVSDVFIHKGAFILLLALFTNEMDEYKKLFIN
ncbi:hypothetical protein BPT24_208 [Tenacibaculum phage pT24]|uniref:Uncharacterized protein n=1 Tax=Tenacibaculum phage pT24 TaxID=1880590 RepID=A0A1B4XWZ0_9CAUD|nr:hypothetical protein HYP10_gp208 [Tenacibaculum phage pT24]BAV39332.1 hypothetical protein BPT24_208 [Tenacibaculum phage pT24]